MKSTNCTQCRQCRQLNEELRTVLLCDGVEESSVVTDVPVIELCDTIRNDETKCGVGGSWFVKKS